MSRKKDLDTEMLYLFKPTKRCYPQYNFRYVYCCNYFSSSLCLYMYT